MKPTITVFTPTYNRAYCLHNGYEALRRQTSKDFIWLVVDDGSTDNTRELIEQWQKNDNGFEIQYLYKENGGLASGYNAAIAVMETELSVCVDSDDYLTDDAIEKVVAFWNKNKSGELAGVIGLDCTPDGKIIGDPLPDQKTVNLIDLLVGRYPIVNGDRKNFVRTDLYRSVAPMKEFPGEKDFNPHYLHIKISRDYDFLVLNEKLCYVDYQRDGMTNTVFKQYLRSPKGFREQRLLDMSLKGVPFLFTVKKTIHYVSSCILAKQPCVSESSRKLLTVLLYPCGAALTFYLKHTQREHI